jgi:hypothetical protein
MAKTRSQIDFTLRREIRHTQETIGVVDFVHPNNEFASCGSSGHINRGKCPIEKAKS